MNLAQQKCVPCEGGTHPYTRKQAEEMLVHLSQWQMRGEAHAIERHFVFQNFQEALIFVQRIGALAETEGHHPDILLHQYKNVTVTLTTHAIGGLSSNDFILAAKIDILYTEQTEK